MTMDNQDQSFFFTKLPPEIRQQIQLEYLASYLRHLSSYDENRLSLVQRIFAYTMPRIYASLLSPLAISCKRMYIEMQQQPTPSTAIGQSFALYHVKTETRAILITENPPDWNRIRRVRFVHEMEHPCTSAWVPAFENLLKFLPHLAELEFEWNPEMSFVHGDDNERILDAIKAHHSIRTIRLRGKVPRVLSEVKPGSIPGRTFITEPLHLWDAEETSRKGQVIPTRANEYYRLLETETMGRVSDLWRKFMSF